MWNDGSDTLVLCSLFHDERVDVSYMEIQQVGVKLCRSVQHASVCVFGGVT